MKKAFTVSVLSLSMALVFSSCEKTYKCECVDSFNNKSESDVYATNKIDAKRNCDARNLQGNCTIK